MFLVESSELCWELAINRMTDFDPQRKNARQPCWLVGALLFNSKLTNQRPSVP